MMNAYEQIWALRKEVETLRGEVTALRSENVAFVQSFVERLFTTFMNGGVVDELSSTVVQRDPATMLVQQTETTRRVVLDEGRTVVERRELDQFRELQETCATASLLAAQFAQRATDGAHRAETLTADLAHIVREIGGPLGFRVVIADDRARVERDPAVARSLDAARHTFHGLAMAAARRMEQEVAAGVRRLLREEAQWLRADLRQMIEQHAAERLGNSPSA